MPQFSHTDGLKRLFIALCITCVLCNSHWNSKHKSESNVSCCIRHSSVLAHTLAQPEKHFRTSDESFVSFVLIFCHDFSHRVCAGEMGCFRNMALFMTFNGALIAHKRTRNIVCHFTGQLSRRLRTNDGFWKSLNMKCHVYDNHLTSLLLILHNAICLFEGRTSAIRFF